MHKVFVTLVFLTSSFIVQANTISVEQVSEQVHLLKGIDYGTNIGLILTQDGLVLIDPMPGDEHLSALDDVIQSIYAKPVKFILNTHEHADHTGGNQHFIQQGARLAPTQNTVLSQKVPSQKVPSQNTAQLQNTVAAQNTVPMQPVIPDILAAQVSSHSSADWIYFHPRSNSLFVGDIVDNSWHPTFYAGGLSGFNAAINHILAIGNEDSLIVPGHGKPSHKDSLRRFQQNTNDWIQQIESLIDSGKSVEQITQHPQIAERVARFNQEGKSPFLPPKALTKFIERTITVIEKERQTSGK
ncbi:MBL fold metallo-hydrolase [Shewanella sp. FJAT-51649]|uniref:MBL fold metallo-hydrolase n=1 Tax=Shewanella sp. FJAT-51649 TaxID=2864210 RepID=UPI001C658585|nr:MBL fold metallo-hydrolase [Shewanella sp. FJAT-51649]QYJ69688.1 MBL fold metallo-hydrolase [Shewanella sp. FJAT-51649]